MATLIRRPVIQQNMLRAVILQKNPGTVFNRRTKYPEAPDCAGASVATEADEVRAEL